MRNKDIFILSLCTIPLPRLEIQAFQAGYWKRQSIVRMQNESICIPSFTCWERVVPFVGRQMC